MQRMNPNGHDLPYWWSAALGFFSLLSLQDYVFIVGAVISAVFTIKTYYSKRKEERKRAEQDAERTRLLKEYLDDVRSTPHPERPKTASVVTEALRMINDEPAEVE